MDPTDPELSKGRYKRVFHVLYRLTQRANENAPLPELLRELAKDASELVGANTCSIFLLDESRAELLTKAAWGLTEEEEARISFRMGEGVAGWAAREGEPAIVADVTADPRFKAMDFQTTQIRSLVVVPLATKEGVIGVICATAARPSAFGRDHQDLLVYLGNSIVKDIENARLYRLSITDNLTKAYNRQYLYQRLPTEVERSRRYGSALSVALFDIDHFKRFNDAFGHPAGDFVLKEVVRQAHQMIREADALVRYGGEEFLLLLPNTPVDGALVIAERFRKVVEGSQFSWGDKKLQVTVSIGLAALRHDVGSDEVLLKRADDALYRAKQGGRNRVEVDPGALGP